MTGISGRRRRLAALLTTIGLALAPIAAAPAAHTADALSSVTKQRIRVYDYDLGDDVFRVAGFHALDEDGMPVARLAPLELIGRVYAPADAGGRRLPVVVMAHGLFWSCADNATGRTAQDWPCRGRFRGIHSERGYDYLGRALARRGIVVVSISANGVNSGELGGVADRARGLLVYEHLRLWQSLVEHGTGRLLGAFVDARTGRRATPDFRHAADLRRVGLLGHSRGGRGMMWAAADAHRALVPRGVRFRAVFGMAAAEPPFMSHGTRRLKVSQIPLMSWIGGCDATGDDSYNRLARRGADPVNIAITVHGANHNNLNSRWAARSGLPGAEDDAQHPRGRPGRCYTWDPADLDRTLGYRAEQRVARAYVTAFFARYLQGATSYDDVLAGDRKPMHRQADVDVQWYAEADGSA